MSTCSQDVLAMLRRAKQTLRNAVYGAPLIGPAIRRALERSRGTPQHSTQEYWDKNLSAAAKSYLGGTMQVDSRDAFTNLLIRHQAGQY